MHAIEKFLKLLQNYIGQAVKPAEGILLKESCARSACMKRWLSDRSLAVLRWFSGVGIPWGVLDWD